MLARSNMTAKWTTKYGLAAILTAILVISVALFANPSIMPKTVSAQSSFAVMLTDPPNVPDGTSVLNMTYSNIELHITNADGTAQWLSVGSSGTVDLFSLINMSQTLASTTIPTNSSVDKIQFTIVTVNAVVNGTLYNVTTLTNTLVLEIANSQINQTLSGVLVDFNPTLLQIQSTDANGNPVDYYVLVPSATATVINGLDQAQIRVGAIERLGQDGRARLTHVVQDFSQNVTITSATLSVNGNTTNLSVTLQNQGDVTFNIFGLTLQGEFNTTQPIENQFQMPNLGDGFFGPRSLNSVPFQINDTSLVPLLGQGLEMRSMSPPIVPQIPQPDTSSNAQPMNITDRGNFPFFGMGHGMQFGRNQGGTSMPFFGTKHNAPNNGPQDGTPYNITGAAASSFLVLQPGQTVTVSFNGIIGLQYGGDNAETPATAITPISGNNYTIGLTGQGFQTFTVTVTS